MEKKLLMQKRKLHFGIKWPIRSWYATKQTNAPKNVTETNKDSALFDKTKFKVCALYERNKTFPFSQMTKHVCENSSVKLLSWIVY